MKKQFILTLLGLMATLSSYCQLLPIYAPAGSSSGCIGATTYLTENDSLPSGTWSSSNTAIASVSLTLSSFSGTATVTGISAGIATITYTLGSAYVTTSFTVSAAPSTITGATPTCVGATSTLADATTGGAWSSGDLTVATVNPSTGLVTGVHGGTTSIFYTVGTGCPASIAVSIATIATGDSIFGPPDVCVGSNITLTDATTGGIWTSGSTAMATVGAASGIVTGVSAGAVTITYTVSSVCAGSASLYKTITVTSTTSIGSISGVSGITVGGPSISLSDGSAGGTWSSSNTAVASVNATSGMVTGIAAGAATITYTISVCGATPYVTGPVTVSTISGISGYVNLPGGPSSGGTVKVWLITYNPSTFMLEAIDSATYASGSSVYYQFTGLATDSFRVKAADNGDTTASGTGYVPTYHTSAYYWHDANVIYHTSGAADINENINLAAGTGVTTGPGFIGGNVMSGANRGTSATVPAVGLLILLQNSTTGAIVQQTLTDASGNYTFASIPYGTYFVYPELINYATTPYTSITLSAASSSVSNASFIQHTVSRTITPVGEAVNNTQSLVASVVAYPNPTSGKLNILWNTATSETGNITITDITGREVYKATIQMNAGSGINQADLSGLTNGLYLISVKSANINYNNKIEVQR